MITISPKYSRRTICHYCGENEAVKGQEARAYFYKVFDVDRQKNTCSFETLELNVPRCEHCAKKHDKASGGCGMYALFFFLLLIPSYLYYLNYNGFDSWADFKADWFGALAGLFTICLCIAFFGAFLLVWLYGKIASLAQSGNRKAYDNVKTYRPAMKIKDAGMSEGFIDQKFEINVFRPYDVEAFRIRFNETLKSIESEDDCSVSGHL